MAITCRCTSWISPVPIGGCRNATSISLEDNQYQYRFKDIIDLDNGRHLFTVEHEVRSFTHPMCLRPLVNRNPAVSNRNYANGYDSSLWAMSPDEYDTVDMRPR